MEHGAIDHADADVRGTAAARIEIDIDDADAAAWLVADFILDGEIVPLAGHRHVGIAVEPKLAGPAGHARRQRRDHRPLGRLRFLAAKTAAHAADPAGHERIRQRENPRDDVLDLARMLGRRIDQHRAVLAWNRERNLAFQIKMFLTADADFSGAA